MIIRNDLTIFPALSNKSQYGSTSIPFDAQCFFENGYIMKTRNHDLGESPMSTTTFQPVTVPAPHPIAGHLRVFSQNQIIYAQELATHGDYVRVRLVNLWMYFLNHPELAHEFMVSKS